VPPFGNGSRAVSSPHQQSTDNVHVNSAPQRAQAMRRGTGTREVNGFVIEAAAVSLSSSCRVHPAQRYHRRHHDR
jgi:hypothetical protein